ncbi:uncharacterized protein EDB91DRAFT_1052028 [Suillus paluster]|uniref:uncharacterized protein n=1 Tax=Suillus paluster TaxID=48578 RepID=UPI001B868BF3|nr:uncharacterized protein EDB91DRAFT_1052028 [Suillus paluster]KAG1742275.1 hypothetical protein EDB91DRAFT_1052028 [Suillus paluster]
MESPRTKRIAISGHKALRLHVATVEGFPSSADRDQLCWDLILESSKQDKLLWEKMKEIQGDDALKAQLIDYAILLQTWKGATQIRGELVAKARISIPACFGQSWTNTNNSYTQNLTCDAQAPLKNPAFRVLLEAQWWGPKGEGRRCGRKGNAYTDNLPILALIGCAVECVLLGVKRGSLVDFSESYFKTRWECFMELLTQFSNKCPTYLETVWDELKEGLWCCQYRKGHTALSTDTPTPIFDFSALETAAKVSKQGKA